MYVLRTTLPTFFETGLVSDVASDGDPAVPADAHADAHAGSGSDGSDARARADQRAPSIYAANIRLSYTPPTALALPLPRTLQVEGEWIR